MAHTIGGVTVSAPIDGEVDYVRAKRWAVAAPLGYTGNINTEMGIAPLSHTLRFSWTSTEKDNIKTLADAGAAVVWVYTNGGMGVTSQSVLIKSFRARKNRAVQGAARWDCELVLEEQP